jgi:hypothetical protein
MLRRDVPIEVVSKTLGHANISMTYRVYRMCSNQSTNNILWICLTRLCQNDTLHIYHSIRSVYFTSCHLVSASKANGLSLPGR